MKYLLKLTMFQRKDMSGFIYFTLYAEGNTKQELLLDYLKECKELGDVENPGYELFPNEIEFIMGATENSELLNKCSKHAYLLEFFAK